MERIDRIHLDVIDSTNAYAQQHAAAFAPDRVTCITAEEQTAGRGRFRRRWHSPRGVNLYATFYFQLPPNTPHLGSLSQWMAACCASLFLEEGLHPKIKWPNDLQLSGKKVAGILCETVFRENVIEVILGIGINVNMSREELAQIDQPATSLREETGRLWDREALLEQLIKKFTEQLSRFRREGFAPFHPLFESLLAYKGQQIRCFDGKKTWEGRCHSITAEGQLIIYLSDGTLHTVLSGDIKI